MRSVNLGVFPDLLMEHDLIQLLGGVVDKAVDSLSLAEKRGRPRVYPLETMIKAFLLMLFKGLSSELDLLRFLELNPEVASALGFEKLPHRTTFLRFRKRYASLIQRLNEQLWRQLPLSRQYGADATVEKKKDPDAQWGKSTGKGWILGFKFHILSDINLGLPLRLEVTSARNHESPRLPKLIKGVGDGDYIMDSGFDSERNHQKIAAEGGFPAICRNKRRKGKPKKTLRNKLRKNRKRKKLLRKRWAVEPVNELFKSILQLPMRLFKGIESVMFYAQLTLMRLLVQALWAYNTRQPGLARVVTYFKHR